jgi:hypothetical protein
VRRAGSTFVVDIISDPLQAPASEPHDCRAIDFQGILELFQQRVSKTAHEAIGHRLDGGVSAVNSVPMPSRSAVTPE